KMLKRTLPSSVVPGFEPGTASDQERAEVSAPRHAKPRSRGPQKTSADAPRRGAATGGGDARAAQHHSRRPRSQSSNRNGRVPGPR
ncbi:MAG TPA: hypothetical protein VND63_02275, partial [Rhodanobacteraceae bacterium]|nr:hypothetical protein [Rhodanobacteraceae bacterium]